MERRNVVVLAVVVALLGLAPVSWAKEPWKKDLEKDLAERFPLSKQAAKKLLGIKLKAGNDIQQLGTVFEVAVENVIAEPTNSGESAYTITPVRDGKVRQSGGGGLGALLLHTNVRPGRRSLKIGERVTPVEFEVRDDAIRVEFVTVETENVMYMGTQFSDHLMGILGFEFPRGALAGATVDQIAPVIEAVLARAPEKGAGPATIALGQSPDEVRRALGAPDKVIELGPKTIWVYRDMKVVFLDRKVSDVQ